MKKMTLLASFFVAALASCCKGQSSGKINADASQLATCSNCGKTACDKSCLSNLLTKNGATMKNKILPSCNLSDKEFVARGITLGKTIFSKAVAISSLKDGYDIVFNEPKEFSLSLIEMVNFERSCCSDFTWALVFEPNSKATHLQVYGSKKVKDEIGNAFKSFGLEHLIK